MTVVYRGSVSDAHQHAGSEPTWNFDLALPTGTQIGDTILLVGTATSAFTVTDSRMTKVQDCDLPDGYKASVWHGIVTDLSNVTGSGTVGTVTNGGAVTAITLKNKANLSRVASASNTATGSHSYTQPGVTGKGAGGVVFAAAHHRLGSATWVAPTGWTHREQTGLYGTVAVATTDDAEVGATTANWSYPNTQRIDSSTVVIGLGGFSPAPPARLFPRADDLGVGGGRHYPPPKSQQRSGRRFGYY